jgi:broad specificity phosphatase PhoE
MSTVVLVRPGCTDFDDQKRIQGSLELPLNERGQSQLEKVVDALRELPVEAVLTGPCDPCRLTAKRVADVLQISLKEKKGLVNLDHGLWQGMSVGEVRRKFPKAFKQWEDAPETVCPPEGETIAEALERIAAALKKPLKKYDTFAVVASEPLASLVSCTLRGTPPDEICQSMFGCCDDHLVEVIEGATSKPDNHNGHSHEIPIPVTSVKT